MGCGASATSAAPSLDLYFEVLRNEVKAESGTGTDFAAAMVVAMDEEGRRHKQDALHTKLRPIIEKAFDHHDTDKSGCLSKEESQLFFKHYLERQAQNAKDIAKLQAKLLQEKALKMMGDMMGRAVEKQMAEQLKKQAEQQFEKTSQRLDDAMKEYFRDKDKFDAEAFAVVDINKDGKLVKSEVVKILLLGTEHNIRFADAFPTGPSYLMRKAVGEMDQTFKEMNTEREEINPDCTTQ